MKLVHAEHLLGLDGVQVTAGVDARGDVHVTVPGGTIRLSAGEAGELAAAVARCAALAGQHHAAGDEGGIPAVVLTGDQAALAARALEDATEFLRERASEYCYECEQAPAGACDDHLGDLDRAAEYADLAIMLPGTQAGQPAPAEALGSALAAALDRLAAGYADLAVKTLEAAQAWLVAVLARVPAASKTTPGPASGQAGGHSLPRSPREES